MVREFRPIRSVANLVGTRTAENSLHEIIFRQHQVRSNNRSDGRRPDKAERVLMFAEQSGRPANDAQPANGADASVLRTPARLNGALEHTNDVDAI